MNNTDFNQCPKCSKEMEFTELEINAVNLICNKCDIYITSFNKTADELRKWWNSVTPKRESIEWKKDFQLYKKMALEAYKNLAYDDVFMSEISYILGDSVDPKATLLKSFKAYWGTERGWDNKRKKRSKTINWKTTLMNSIERNRVWYPKQMQIFQQPVNPIVTDKPDYE